MQVYADKLSGSTDTEKGNAAMPMADLESSTLFSAEGLVFPEDTADRPDIRYGYIIAGLHFLVPEKMISEVIQNPKIFNLPNSPEWVEGLINVRGSIIPVMNIARLLKNNLPVKDQRVLLLNDVNEKQAVAIIIDELPVSLVYEDLPPTKEAYPGNIQDYLGEGFQHKGTSWIEFRPQDLFKKLANKNNSQA